MIVLLKQGVTGVRRLIGWRELEYALITIYIRECVDNEHDHSIALFLKAF
jgi:hypothetical protein